MAVTFEDIRAAREAIRGGIKETPCREGDWLSKEVGTTVLLKLENLQHTGSFKARGALYKLQGLSDEQKRKGVVAASAGNHAQGVAYHATRLGIPSTIVMPVGTPLVKVTKTAGYGAHVVLEGADLYEAMEKAHALEEETGATLIHAYDDDRIIAGQGTLGLEMLEQDPYLDVVVVPVGGGGLISGIALALKRVKPNVRVVGVESEGLCSMKAAIDAGQPVTLPPATTLADGIAVRRAGARTATVCADHVDEWVSVSDDEIARAILFLLEREKIVAEGAGAAGVAALLAGKVPALEHKNVVALVCGGNIDVNVLNRIIDRGLVESGRLTYLVVRTQDRPGGLAHVLSLVAERKANVVEVHHERAFSAATLSEVEIGLKLETKGPDHVEDILAALKAAGVRAERELW